MEAPLATRSARIAATAGKAFAKLILDSSRPIPDVFASLHLAIHVGPVQPEEDHERQSL